MKSEGVGGCVESVKLLNPGLFRQKPSILPWAASGQKPTEATQAAIGITFVNGGEVVKEMDITCFEIGNRMSQAVFHGDIVYLAGQVANDTSADIKGQTRQVLSDINQLLTSAGTGKSRLLSATIWLADVSTFDAMNEMWDAWVAPGQTPARACVEAKPAAPEYIIEISLIATR